MSQPNSGTTPILQRVEVSTGGTAGFPARALTGARTRGTATFVADMGSGVNKDSLPELLVEADAAGSWLIFWSHSDYTTSTLVATDGHSSHMLLLTFL